MRQRAQAPRRRAGPRCSYDFTRKLDADLHATQFALSGATQVVVVVGAPGGAWTVVCNAPAVR